MNANLSWKSPLFDESNVISFTANVIVTGINDRLASWNVTTYAQGGVKTNIIRDGWNDRDEQGKADFAALRQRELKFNVRVGKTLVTFKLPKYLERDLAAFLNNKTDDGKPEVLGRILRLEFQGNYVVDELTGEIALSKTNKVETVMCHGLRITVANPPKPIERQAIISRELA